MTGASRGIGFAIAQALAAEGCRLIVTARHADSLGKAARRLKLSNRQLLATACDVREPASVEKLFAAIERRFGRLDIMVNNAGIAHPSLTVDRLPFATWKDVMDTNLHGMFLVTRSALRLMKPGSVIVNNLSIAAKRVFPGSSAYDASKHGALGFTNGLREELRPRGIRVIAVLPGATNTDIWNTLWPKAPRKKMMAAETVANAVVSALKMPAASTVEELTILPAAGAL